MAPTASYQVVRDAIFAGADPVPSLAGITVTGGRLNASGALRRIGMTVRDSNPAAGAIVTTPPVDFVVDFSLPLDPSTLDPADLTVNLIPADSVTLVDADTVQFHFNSSPVTTEGLQTMQMAAAALASTMPWNPQLYAWSASFRYDVTRMQVVATLPANGSVVSLPFTSLRIDVNEPVDPSTIGADDLVLNQGRVIGAAAIDADTIEYTLADISSEGMLAVVLPAGALADGHGNPMLPYEGALELDFGTVVFPTPLYAREPRGSLVYDGTAAGLISFAGDVDRFTLNIAGGQTITVAVDPAAGLQPAIEVFDPQGTSLGSASSASPGTDAVLQTVTASTAGTYTVAIGEVGGTTGACAVQIILNAAVDVEAHGGPRNDSIATAQNIEPGFITLAAGAERAAVLGETETEEGNFYGPEGFGYEARTVPFAFEDISTTGHPTMAGADSTEKAIKPGGGFAFSFYGVTYQQVILASNGTITFEWDRNQGNTYNGWFVNGDLTGRPLVAAIAPFWDDLEIVGPNAAVYWEVRGSGNDQRLIVQWHNVRLDDVTVTPGDMIFQAVLYEKDGSIQFNYLNIDKGGASFTVGIKDVGVQGPNRLLLAFNSGPNEFVGSGRSTLFRLFTPATDYYAFTLAAGQPASLALTALNPQRRGKIRLELRDGSGSLLASGNTPLSNVDSIIEGFVPSVSGTYYAVLTGEPRAQYTLVVTRGATVDVENNDDTAASQALGARRVILGAVTPKITPGAGVIESFDDGNLNEYSATGPTPDISVTATAAHDGPFGLEDADKPPPNAWIYRDDSAVHLQRGDVVSVWLQTRPATDPFGLAFGRGYFGFGATAAGTLSVVMAPEESTEPNNGDLLIQRNTGYGFETIASGSQPWLVDHWYRIEVTWIIDGSIVVRLFDSDGTMLLNTVTGRDDTISSGGIAFRSFYARKFFDTVQIGLPNPDLYRIALAQGDVLTVNTSTPLGSLNGFDPLIRLYGPSGISVAADDNSAVDGRNARLRFTATAAGVYYIEVAASNLTAKPTTGEYIVDIDISPTPAIQASPSSGLQTTEASGSASFQVVLTTQPTAQVIVAVSSTDATEGVVTPTTLTFTPETWNVSQTVTVTGVDDALVDGDIAYTVTLSAQSVDAAYDGATASVAVTNLDNEPAGNANAIYVWDIAYETRTRGSKQDARVVVTVRRDSNADDLATSADALAPSASVTAGCSFRDRRTWCERWCTGSRRLRTRARSGQFPGLPRSCWRRRSGRPRSVHHSATLVWCPDWQRRDSRRGQRRLAGAGPNLHFLRSRTRSGRNWWSSGEPRRCPGWQCRGFRRCRKSGPEVATGR